MVSVSSPQGRFAESAALLDQTRMIEATAHGKHLFCEFDRDRAAAHPLWALIGSIQLGPPAPPRGEVRVRIAADRAAADLRGPQLCSVQAAPRRLPSQSANYGPDPLRADADPGILHGAGSTARLGRSPRC